MIQQPNNRETSRLFADQQRALLPTTALKFPRLQHEKLFWSNFPYCDNWNGVTGFKFCKGISWSKDPVKCHLLEKMDSVQLDSNVV